MDENNYGFLFNDIKIDENCFYKKSKNTLGKIKINNEIRFYLYIIENNIHFPMPTLLNHGDGTLSLQYIKNASTLTYIINSKNINEYIHKIIDYINIIHKIKNPILFNTIKIDLDIELRKKVLDRYNEYDWNSNSLYNSIKSVNNIKIKDIYYYSEIIHNKIISYLDNREHYNLIHGDIHLGNILLDENNNIIFIDPRGSFGDTKLFGLYEYDYAKLLFGISGYSFFDNMIISDLCINDNNIHIDFIKDYEYIFENKIFDKITILLCLSIWLANNSCFSNINKKITSLMIAYYYCEKYI